MNFNKRLRLAQEKFAEGKAADENTEYQRAADTLLAAADLFKGIKGQEQNYAACLVNAANSFARLGSYEQAKKLIEKALPIQKKFFGSNHPEIANSLNTLAVLSGYQKDDEQAIYLHEKALEIRRKAVPADYPAIAGSLNNLGLIYDEQKNYEKAKSLYEQALEIRREALPADHPDIATSLSNLAIILREEGDYEAAKSLNEQALEIRRKVLPADHPAIAQSLNNLANIVGDQEGDYAQAKSLHGQANEILGKKLGVNHPDTNVGINNLTNTILKATPLDSNILTSIAKLHEDVFQFLIFIEDKKVIATIGYPTFRTSKNDEQGRLSKGYWFSGDDEQLYFSCWKGIDTTVQMPTIAIVINTQQQVTLQLNGKDSAKKAEFLADLTKLLGGFSQSSDVHGRLEARWRKTYSQETWQQALEEFFTTDKPQIDEYLAFNNNAVEDFTPIPEKEFAQSLKFTVFLREKLKEAASTEIRELAEVGKPLKLQSLQLENIGHFESVGFDLSRQVTILIGENGSGKSTILKAIALALYGKAKILDFELIKYYLRILKTDEDGTKHFCKKGYIHLNLQINTTQSQIIEFNDTELGGLGIETFVDNNDEWLLASENRFIDLVLAFPQGKKRDSKSFGKIVEPNLNDVIDLIEDRDIHTWKAALVEWTVAFAREPDAEIREKNLAKIKWVFDIISKIISETEPNAIRLKSAVYNPNTGEKDIIICTPDMPDGISLDLLSQGYTKIFVWVGRLIMRLYAALSAHQFEQTRDKHLFLRNPNTRGKRYEANTIQDLHGVVLIDEIDTYLHPQWQRNILQVLAETFPCLQFVVTSHSLAVLSSLKDKNSYMIYRAFKDDEGQTLFEELDPQEQNPYGADLNTIADDFMGFPEREPEIKDKLETLRSAIARKQIEAADNLISELEAEINPEDKDLNKSKSRLDAKKLIVSKK